MSINFDPRNNPNAAEKPKEPCNRYMGFLKAYMDMQHEGFLKEAMPSETYCQRAWRQQKETDSSQVAQEFMEACIKDCEYFKTFCQWSRMN